MAEAGALAVVVFWAANFIVVKAANQQIPPLTFAFIRFGGAGLLLLGLLRLREGSVRMPWPELRPILGLGAIGFGIYQVLWATGLQSISPGTSAFLIAATPVMTAFVAVLAGSDVLTRPKLVGGLVSFAGVAVVIIGGVGLALDSSVLGDALTLVAAVCWAIYTSFGAPVLRRHSPLRTTAWAMIGGGAVLALPGIGQSFGAQWSTVQPGAWAGLLYSALIPAGAANVVIFHGIRLLGPTRITAFQFLVPFITALMAVVALSEPISSGELLGGAIIVLGVAITRLGARGGGFAARLRVLLPID
ncbi:MAG TPA: DMT family transporter [Candidatus Limnocylindrales bacterium]|nr:DMT family transporter [Candidatus Limnocylindrales bacterium]